MSNTDRMTNTRFTITIDIQPDSDHEAEDIFDAVQLLLADEFGGEAEASFGSPDDLIDGDDLVRKVLPMRDLTPEQSRRLLAGILAGKGTYEEGKEFPYAIRIAFIADRELTEHELSSLTNAAATQIDDPHIPDADGEMDRADFSVREVIAKVVK